MSTLKLHGSLLSAPLLRVLATIYEKELDYEFVPVDMGAGDHKKEPFLSLNPFGQIPAFEDGDLKLFESRAINKYIAQTYASSGTQLLPEDHKKMAIVAVWMEVEAQQYEPAATKLGFELGLKPMFGMVTDEAVVEENEAKLSKVLDVYEARLGESKYLGGDEFSLADLHHLPTINYFMNTRVKRLFDSHPRVCAWWKDISARPAWAKVAKINKEELLLVASKKPSRTSLIAKILIPH